jgi:hypothetical protein
LLPAACPDCCGRAAARAGRSPNRSEPRRWSGHPGGLARPAPPQPLERRERALVQRLERPRWPAAEQALRSIARGALDPPRGAGRGACIPSNLGVQFTVVLHDRLLCRRAAVARDPPDLTPLMLRPGCHPVISPLRVRRSSSRPAVWPRSIPTRRQPRGASASPLYWEDRQDPRAGRPVTVLRWQPLPCSGRSPQSQWAVRPCQPHSGRSILTVQEWLSAWERS